MKKKLLSILLTAAMLLSLALPVLGQEDAQARYSEIIAVSQVELNGAKAPGVCTEETNFGDLVTDAILWCVRKEGGLPVPEENVIAMVNGGSIRATVAAGDVTRGDISSALPSGSTVCVVYVTGETLLRVLEAATFCAPDPASVFPQVAGLSFAVDATRPYDKGGQYSDTIYYAPAAVNRVRVDSVNGKPLDPAATYAVVTNDFVAAGGDSYFEMAQPGAVIHTGVPVDEIVMDYITAALGSFVPADQYAAPQGRITVESAPAAWYTSAVNYVQDKGIMTGTGVGFEPDGVVSRATVFQTFYNMEGKPAGDGGLDLFPDARGAWYEPAARWAGQTGLTTGTGNGFEGDRPVSRWEIALILYRYARFKDLDLSVGEYVNLLTQFADAELLNYMSVPAFQWAVGARVISGKVTGDGVSVLAPNDTTTRAELAQLLTNFNAADIAIAPEEDVPGQDAPEQEAPAPVTLSGRSVAVNKYGDVVTDMTGDAFAAAGFAVGDVVQITVGEQKRTVQAPCVTDYADVELWREAVILRDNTVILAINMGDFGTTYGIASRGDSVFSYQMTKTDLTLTLLQKGGYAGELARRSVGGKLIAQRDAAASDEAFANFRGVTVGDIAPGVLYRSASPIAVGSARAPYADALLGQSGIKTIVNMADCRNQAPEYAGFADTRYAKVHEDGGTVYLNMGSDMYVNEGLDDLRNGLDFMAEREGPYLIHSGLGKDRAGHLIFLLEALMGADIRDIVADYMLSYENLYGIHADSEAWSAIAEGTIEKEIIRLLDASDLFDAADKAADGGLAAAAENYLLGAVGLTQAQVDSLKTKLAG